jgi:putative DNA primase/helicase
MTDKSTGDIDTWASEIISRLQTYSEISPSETGVKMLARGIKPGPRCRTTEMLERFKGIVGEDEQIINPKGKPAYKQKLYVRFTIAVNAMPKMPDASAAMRPRLLVFRYRKSYEGKEDAGLEDRLKPELPGIINWALEGLRRLRLRGRFVQPSAGLQLLDQFTRASSPVKAFLEECCEVKVGSDVYAPKRDLYRAWCRWCDSTGHKAGSDETFGTNLYAAVAALDETRPTIDGVRVRCYQNIRLKEGVIDSLDREFEFPS